MEDKTVMEDKSAADGGRGKDVNNRPTTITNRSSQRTATELTIEILPLCGDGRDSDSDCRCMSMDNVLNSDKR